MRKIASIKAGQAKQYYPQRKALGSYLLSYGIGSPECRVEARPQSSSLDYRLRSLDEDRALVNACRDGDGATARQILSAHLGDGSRTLIASMKVR